MSTEQERAEIEAQVTKNRTNALGVVTNLAKKDAADKEQAKVKAAAGPNFHARQALARAADPENKACQQAMANGMAAAHNFLGAVNNPSHPDHEKNLKVFKQGHGMDENNTIADFQARACRDAGAGPFEMRDLAYESNICKPYRPTADVTATKMAFHANMQKALRDKWDAVGYKGDKDFIEDYADKYGLTRDDKSAEMRKIQPKR